MKRLASLPFLTKSGEIVKPKWQYHTATVLVFLHDAHCIACKEICRNFAEIEKQFEEWGARLWLVWRGNFVPEGCEGFREVNGKVRLELLGENSTGVLIVDRHGVVVKKWSALEGFPSPSEVLTEAQHIALQCPE